jgi:hypothetical protein
MYIYVSECCVFENRTSSLATEIFKGLELVILIGYLCVRRVAMLYLKHITIYFIIYKCD